ncbi:MAG TPA: DUF2309 domain-containing protein [Methylotenera sp.]|nr:DUF2309 domain-containing protein [Methylotenera sp.]
MDSGILTTDYESSNYTPTLSWRESIENACQQACQMIAPSWPLDRAIAVNPHWKRINLPLRQVAARMAVLGGINVLPKRDHVEAAWMSGRINPVDLNYALKNTPEAKALLITEEECKQALKSPLQLEQLPLLIDVLDDDPNKHTRLSWRQAITHQVSQTCAAYFDTEQADWQPDRKEGLYAFWRDTLTHDHGIGILMGLPDLGKKLHALPATATEAERWVLQRIGLPEYAWADYLEALLLTVNGWASWCAYLGWQAELQGKTDPHLRELLAIRLAWGAVLLECKDDLAARIAFATLQEKWCFASHLLKQAEQKLMIDEVWQLAMDAGYQRQLAKSLAEPEHLVKTEGFAENQCPEVQAAFCIDVRSERLRRALEQTYPGIQTMGFAGFFGLPISYSPLGTSLKRPQMPGLLAPTVEVTEQICQYGCDDQQSQTMTANARRSRQLQLARSAQWDAGSRWPGAAFSFVESVGLGYVAKLGRWIRPSRNARKNHDQAGLIKRYRINVRPMLHGTDLDYKIATASQILHALGLDKAIAPLVLLVGHGSQSENNAHAAGLDCGACCGQTGEVNARVLANLLNDTAVRGGLQMKGIFIPFNTVFVAAMHNTTTDEIEAFDLDMLSPEKRPMWNKLSPALTNAGNMVRRERAQSLGINSIIDDATLLKSLRQRANDGAQTRPEWGLAGNAAFIIAPRYRTKHSRLNGRAFLHDYDAEQDKDGSLLELLMTAPMLVTHWINWQYHASTVDPKHMGCGNKVLHNVVGSHIGVFEGNGGDLRIGLSKQSLHNGQEWVHDPLRLTVVIDAPTAAIERIMHKHNTVRYLVEHGWLHLWRYESTTLQRYASGQWLDVDLH